MPHFIVNSLPLMCFLARRDNGDIAVGIGTKCQRLSHKNSISTQGGPRLEQRTRLGQFTLVWGIRKLWTPERKYL